MWIIDETLSNEPRSWFFRSLVRLNPNERRPVGVIVLIQEVCALWCEALLIVPLQRRSIKSTWQTFPPLVTYYSASNYTGWPSSTRRFNQHKPHTGHHMWTYESTFPPFLFFTQLLLVLALVRSRQRGRRRNDYRQRRQNLVISPTKANRTKRKESRGNRAAAESFNGLITCSLVCAHF